MTATFEQAIDDLKGLVQDFWDTEPLAADVQLVWENADGERPIERSGSGAVVPYAEVSVQHLTGGPRSLGNVYGMRRETYTGVLEIVLKFPTGQGDRDLLPFAQRVKEDIQRRTTSNGVITRTAKFREDGVSGDRSMATVTFPFEYDFVG